MKTNDTAQLAPAIETHILALMSQSRDNIVEIAREYGFKGDEADSTSLLEHLSNTSLPSDDYAHLYANSERLSVLDALICEFGTVEGKQQSRDLVAYDYVG